MTKQAHGTFDVTLTQQSIENATDDAMMQRRAIDKRYHGPLDGTAVGQMLSVGSAAGSGVYVAVERVTATLDGRTGTFALYHTGTMERGTPTLSIRVVPDSGTGELEGLRGMMTIDIRDKQHLYTFDYAIG